MMSEPFFYCSELSRKAGERAYGTASVGDVWLLLEYPYAWGSRALQDSRLSTEIKTYLNKALKSIPRARLLLIKHDRTPQSYINFYIVCSRASEPFIVRFKLDSYERLPEIDMASVASGNSPNDGVVLDHPLFLVCTHGRRDKCCAKFGYPLYKSLRQHYPREFLWQSSHVGGDRFAANLVCFPHGLFYGHVTEQSGLFIINEYEQERIALENYRGRACFSHPVQAAEFFIRQESGLSGLEELRQVNCAQVNESTWLVRFIAPRVGDVHEAKVTTHVSEFQNYITCHATEENSVVQYLLEDYRVINDRSPVRT